MTEIQRFYSGQRVLITGATGFLGKALLERLLRSTEVVRIYVLIREKRHRTIQQRLDELLSQSLFEELTKKSETAADSLLARLTAVRGDCGQPELGLSAADRDLLLRDVTVVFHCAATVRFTVPLQEAVRINVASTQDLLELARRMEHLQSFVHVSTAYVGCTQPCIDEGIVVVPKTALGGGDVFDACRRIQQMEKQQLRALTPRILDKYPNTYVFTKTLAEEVVAAMAGDLPLAIFRPGLVVAAYAEPHPGWVGNSFGIPELSASFMLGSVHILRCSRTATIAAVPVDYCVNAMIACGCRTALEQRSETSAGPTVYNCVAEASNPIGWRELFGRTIELARRRPVRGMAWYPFLLFTESRFVRRLLHILLGLLPMMIYSGLTVFGTRAKRPPSIYWRVHNLIAVVEFFLMRQWTMSTGNLRRLWAGLGEEDRRMFPFDMLQLDWRRHTCNSVEGIRRQLLREDPETLDEGRKRYQILRFVHYFTVLVGIGFLGKAIHWSVSLTDFGRHYVAGLCESGLEIK